MEISIISDAQRISRQLRADQRSYANVLRSALSSLAYQARVDSQEAMRTQLDRPKRFSQNAVIFQQATRSRLRSAVMVNPRNEYLHFMVFGGPRRPKNKRIVIPDRGLRTDASGNWSRARRKRALQSPKTFKVRTRQGNEVLLQRVGKKVRFLASLSKGTQYKTNQHYWKFYEAAEITYNRHFERLFNKAYRRYGVRR